MTDDARVQAIRQVARDIEMSYETLLIFLALHATDEDADCEAAWAACLDQTTKALEALIAAQCGVADAERDQALTHQQLAEARAASAEQRLIQVEAARDELRVLSGIGVWHKDCRPNREMAARELQKSQAIIDKLADEISTIHAHAEAAEAVSRRLQELIVMWRTEAAIKDSFHATMGIGWKVCADQLAALLAAGRESVGEPMPRREEAYDERCAPSDCTERTGSVGGGDYRSP